MMKLVQLKNKYGSTLTLSINSSAKKEYDISLSIDDRALFTASFSPQNEHQFMKFLLTVGHAFFPEQFVPFIQEYFVIAEDALKEVSNFAQTFKLDDNESQTVDIANTFLRLPHDIESDYELLNLTHDTVVKRFKEQALTISPFLKGLIFKSLITDKSFYEYLMQVYPLEIARNDLLMTAMNLAENLIVQNIFVDYCFTHRSPANHSTDEKINFFKALAFIEQININFWLSSDHGSSIVLYDACAQQENNKTLNLIVSPQKLELVQFSKTPEHHVAVNVGRLQVKPMLKNLCITLLSDALTYLENLPTLMSFSSEVKHLFNTSIEAINVLSDLAERTARAERSCQEPLLASSVTQKLTKLAEDINLQLKKFSDRYHNQNLVITRLLQELKKLTAVFEHTQAVCNKVHDDTSFLLETIQAFSYEFLKILDNIRPQLINSLAEIAPQELQEKLKKIKSLQAEINSLMGCEYIKLIVREKIERMHLQLNGVIQFPNKYRDIKVALTAIIDNLNQANDEFSLSESMALSQNIYETHHEFLQFKRCFTMDLCSIDVLLEELEKIKQEYGGKNVSPGSGAFPPPQNLTIHANVGMFFLRRQSNAGLGLPPQHQKDTDYNKALYKL